MERYTMFFYWKNQYCQNDYATQSYLQIQCNPYQFTNSFFHRIRTKNFTIFKETQKTPNNQSNLEKEKLTWRNQAPWLQTILQSYSNQNSIVLAQKQKYRSMEQDRKPRNRPRQIQSTDFEKRTEAILWTKIVFSTNNVGITRHPHAKKKKKVNLETNLTPFTNIKWK